MIPTVTNRLVLAATAIVAVVGAVDAAAGDAWDLVALFALIALLQLGLLVRLSARRSEVLVRADLVRWLRDRSEVEADRVEHLIDRAVSAYRAALLGADPSRPDESPGGGVDDRSRPS